MHQWHCEAEAGSLASKASGTVQLPFCALMLASKASSTGSLVHFHFTSHLRQHFFGLSQRDCP
jgi:hypothetical protein